MGTVKQAMPLASASDIAPTQGALDVAWERYRQIVNKGFGPEHDIVWRRGELLQAALEYARHALFHGPDYIPNFTLGRYQCTLPDPDLWPWDKSWWKPMFPRQDLVRAAALIIAEIDRMDAADKGAA